MADSLPPINANQAIVDPATGRGRPAFILLVNALIGKVVSAASATAAAVQAQLTAFLATTPMADAPLSVTGTYGSGLHFSTGDTGISVSDGTTTVDPATSIVFTGATVSDGGSGEAGVLITGGGGGGGGLFDLSAGVPAFTDFTLLNVAATTVIDEVSGKALRVITAPAATATGWQMAYKTVPTAPYRIAILVQGNAGNATNGIGLGWRDNATGHIHIIWQQTTQFLVQRYSSPTAFVSNDLSYINNAGPMYWVGLRDDGTTVYFELSYDGVQFQTFFKVAKSSGYLGTSGYNQAFFGALCQSTQAQANLSIRCWDENGLTRGYP